MRARAALTAMGLALPSRRVLINLAPADLLKEGSHFDLPIAIGVLAAMGVLPRDEVEEYAALGELSLDGSICRVAGVLPAAIGSSTLDLGLICGADQGGEAAWAGRIEVLAPPDLLSLINHFRGTQVLTPPAPSGLANGVGGPDLGDVRGMETARRSVEIAAAGGQFAPVALAVDDTRGETRRSRRPFRSAILRGQAPECLDIQRPAPGRRPRSSDSGPPSRVCTCSRTHPATSQRNIISCQEEAH